MSKTEQKPVYNVVYEGLFLTGEHHLADVRKAAVLSGVHIHPLKRVEEHVADKIDPLTGTVMTDPATEEVMKVIKGTPTGTTLVEIMRSDGKTGLADFWGHLDQIIRHPSRRREPIRKKQPKSSIRSRSRYNL